MISCFHLKVPHPYRQRPLLDDVSLEIEKGEFVEIVGPAGAGKSVLFSLLSLRAKAAYGKCIIGGRNLERLDSGGLAELRSKIGSCAQRPEFLEERTVLENLILPLVARSISDGALEEVEALIKDTGLEPLAKTLAGGLSDAERRLAGIFRALVGSPSLVLIDGGLAGLGELRDDARAALAAAYKAGATVILTGRKVSSLDELRTATFHLADGDLEPDDTRGGDSAATDGAA